MHFCSSLKTRSKEWRCTGIPLAGFTSFYPKNRIFNRLLDALSVDLYYIMTK